MVKLGDLMNLFLWLYHYMQLHLIVLFSVQDLYPWQWHMELVIQLFIIYQCRLCMVDKPFGDY